MTYSSSLSINRQRYAVKQQNTVSSRSNIKTLGPIANIIMVVVLICLLGLLYLTQVTKTNSFGYQINALQLQQNELKVEHDELEITAARLQALDRIKNSEVAKNLVSVAPTTTIQ